jgi:hypothetical protein
MAATKDARTAKRKLSELGITSATVLTGPTTITIDLAAFDELVRSSVRHIKESGSASEPTRCPDWSDDEKRLGRDWLTSIQRGPTS